MYNKIYNIIFPKIDAVILYFMMEVCELLKN